ncbi:MAG: energy transducer TonB [Candidatus Acidiferrales bacterium]
MRRAARIALIGLAASLFFECTAAHGDDKAAEAVALLDRARTLEDLRGEGALPFVLRARIRTENDSGPLEGTYSLTWFAANRWHEELRLGSFKRARDGVDGGYRQVRSLDFQPQSIFDVDRLLGGVLRVKLTPKETAGNAHTRKVNGVEMSCIEIRAKDSAERGFCFDPAGGLLLHTEVRSYRGDEIEVSDFGGVATLGTKKFPTQMKLERPREKPVNVDVEELGPAPGDASSLPAADPARSEFWGTCNDAVPAVLTHHVAPIYPHDMNGIPENGKATVYMRVETDGTTSHLRALSAPSVPLAQAALNAVTQWKWTPELCGNTPVKVESIISVFYASRL